MTASRKPVPVVTPWGKPFWDSAKLEKLMIQKCKGCERLVFYPRLACPHCLSGDLDWVEVSGKGTVYSYTIVQSNAPTPFKGDMPYVVAIVRLEEGVQMLTNIVGCDPEEVTCDMPVEVTFEKLDDDFTLPKFRPTRT